MHFNRLSFLYSGLLLFTIAAAQLVAPAGSPDTSQDPYPPYPPLNGNPSAQNWLGTRLFGWKGCAPQEIQDITDAYNDMYKISNLAANYANINWKGPAAIEFFGPSAGQFKLTDDVKQKINNILTQVQQMYYTWKTPKSQLGALWIRVRCSGGDGTGDPNNKCGDDLTREPGEEEPPRCPDGSRPLPIPDPDPNPNPAERVRLEAYSDPGGKGDWSQITFCTGFFTKNDLTDAMKQPYVQNLQLFDNRARIFFHEATHLDYFMNAGDFGSNPSTDDLTIKWRQGGFTNVDHAYGALNARILGKYRASGQQGYYTQRNADNFAFFALANYVESEKGQYPKYPTAGHKPAAPPRERNGNPLFIAEYDSDTFLQSLYSAGGNTKHPGCGDRSGASSNEVTVDGSMYSDSEQGPEYAAQRQAWLADYYTFAMNNKIIRLLPLGDSITYGFQSTSGNGFRQELFTQLSGNGNTGNTIDFIGSVRAGNMADGDNEGHNGATIDEISSFATSTLQQRPNVVLLHAGTNDMNRNLDISTAPDRLGNLIDKIVAACPDAAVLVAQIIGSGDPATQSRIIQFNKAIPGVVAARQAQGHRVMVVDMFGQLTSSDYTDDLHPNNQGYTIMGKAWYRAIAYANAELHMIDDPKTSTGGNALCTNFQPFWIAQGTIANGAGLGKNRYPSIICKDYPGDRTGTQCSCGTGETGEIFSTQFRTGDSCEAMGYDLINAVHFADLNGDGRAEYLWVGERGEVTAFLNLGSEPGPNAGKVGWLPSGVIATGVGGKRHEIQFADLNGDGRAEYLWVHPNGSVEAWLNLGGSDNGPNAAKVGWLPQGMIASGIGQPGSSVVFADLNGDGRAEYLSISPKGAVTCYLNAGAADNNGPNAGKVTWIEQGVIATGVQGVRNNTVFADMNGNGRADYLKVNRQGSGSVSLYQNLGGPDNGPNAARVVWYPRGSITGGDGSSGANVMFADLNGDGRAEYLEVNPDTSAVIAYLNGC